jgi:hypothetical protein
MVASFVLLESLPPTPGGKLIDVLCVPISLRGRE